MIKELPYLDLRLTEESMNYLWDIINHPIQPPENVSEHLAGNISKSNRLQNKDNWFYENVLKECSEQLYYKDWPNKVPPSIFKLEKLWVNYQKQHEFNPSHSHGGLFSFVVFMKIPTHWKEQHKLPISANSNHPQASDFQFLLGQGREVKNIDITLSPEDEGRMLFFPAWLSHQVYPFYGTEEERITISGNIFE
jgi:hypothetical protein